VTIFAYSSRWKFRVLRGKHSGLKLNRKLFLNEPIRHPFGFNEAHIVASRGCIYNCTFCAAARSLNIDTPIRERSEESLVEELIEINKNYPGVDSIRVLDDLFLKFKSR